MCTKSQSLAENLSINTDREFRSPRVKHFKRNVTETVVYDCVYYLIMKLTQWLIIKSSGMTFHFIKIN